MNGYRIIPGVNFTGTARNYAPGNTIYRTYEAINLLYV